MVSHSTFTSPHRLLRKQLKANQDPTGGQNSCCPGVPSPLPSVPIFNDVHSVLSHSLSSLLKLSVCPLCWPICTAILSRVTFTATTAIRFNNGGADVLSEISPPQCWKSCESQTTLPVTFLKNTSSPLTVSQWCPPSWGAERHALKDRDFSFSAVCLSVRLSVYLCYS